MVCEDKKSPSPPPPRLLGAPGSPSPPPPKMDIISRVQRRAVKWSTNSTSNKYILSRPDEFSKILSDMSTRVSKINKPLEHVQHFETIKVALKYSKYSESDINDELVNCMVRALVRSCGVTFVPQPTRSLLTSVYLYDYSVLLEDYNSTTIAISAQGEVADAETVDAINMTVISDQIMVSGGSVAEQDEFADLAKLEVNMTDDDYFTFDSSKSNDVWVDSYMPPDIENMYTGPLVLPPPPSVSHQDPISGGVFMGIAAGVAVMAGLIGLIATRRNRNSARRTAAFSSNPEFMVSQQSPLINGSIDYSINPIHNNVGP